MDEKMFCFQCEQAANGCACVGNAGVCGKSAETADAQDALTGALIGFAELLVELGQPIQPPQALLLLEGLFTTITNVNFDPETVRQLTEKVWEAKNAAFATACPAPAPVGDYDMKQLWQEPDEDIRSLKSTVLFGLRGMAAYTYATSEAMADAELALLRQAVYGKKFSLPICVDVEENKLKQLSTLDLSNLTAYALEQVERMGFYAQLYTYTGYKYELDMARLSSRWDVWLADYTGKPPAVTF